MADAEATFESLLRSRVDLALAWRGFIAEMVEAQKPRGGREPSLHELAQTCDTRRTVREALSGDIIATAPELEGRKRQVDEALSTVGTLQDIAGSLWTIQYWLPNKTKHAEALDELWTQLAGMPNPATDVEILRRAARVLLDAVIVERRGLRADTLAPSGEDTMLGAIEIAGRRPMPAAADGRRPRGDAARRAPEPVVGQCSIRGPARGGGAHRRPRDAVLREHDLRLDRRLPEHSRVGLRRGRRRWPAEEPRRGGKHPGSRALARADARILPGLTSNRGGTP